MSLENQTPNNDSATFGLVSILAFLMCTILGWMCTYFSPVTILTGFIFASVSGYIGRAKWRLAWIVMVPAGIGVGIGAGVAAKMLGLESQGIDPRVIWGTATALFFYGMGFAWYIQYRRKQKCINHAMGNY